MTTPPRRRRLRQPPAIAQDAELARRESMSFEQAEGLDVLPTQLSPQEITPELRSLIWASIYFSMQAAIDDTGFSSGFEEPWNTILRRKHITRDHRPIDEFIPDRASHIDHVKRIFMHGDYAVFYGTLQWLLRQEDCPADLLEMVTDSLPRARSGYRLINGRTLVPISDEREAAAIEGAFKDTTSAKFSGTHQHLQAAANSLGEGNWADSVRESIHAVESAARQIVADVRTLGPALDALEKKKKIHGSQRKGFDGLYGWTCDEKGIRHPLLDKAEAAVDEADAQFMLGACASFVSYLLARAR